MPEVAATFKRIAGNGLSNGLPPFMDFAIRELLLVLELDEELRAVVAGRENGAFVAEQQAAAAGNLVHQGLHVSSDLFRGLIGAVVLVGIRSEEHTSELQSLRHLVCR